MNKLPNESARHMFREAFEHMLVDSKLKKIPFKSTRIRKKNLLFLPKTQKCN